MPFPCARLIELSSVFLNLLLTKEKEKTGRCAVILEPKKITSVTVSTFSPSIYHEVMGLGAMILVFP